MYYLPIGVNGLIVVKNVFHNCIPVLEVNFESENVREMYHCARIIRQNKCEAAIYIDVQVSKTRDSNRISKLIQIQLIL